MYDMRLLGRTAGGLTTRPCWPVPNLAGASFQRNLGAIVQRPLGGVRGWASESSICEIRDSLRVGHALWTPQGLPIRPAFKRFYNDGDGGAHFSIGFPLPASYATSRKSLGAALDRLLSLHVETRHGPLSCDLASAGELIAQLFDSGTTKGNRPSESGFGIAVGSPLIIVDGPTNIVERRLFRSATPYAKAADAMVQNVHVGQHLSVLAVAGLGGRRAGARVARIILARLYLELFCFEQGLHLLSSPALGELSEGGSDVLLTRIAQSVRRLSHGTNELYAELNEAFATVHKPGRLDDLKEALRIVGASRNLIVGIRHAIERTGVDIDKLYEIQGGNTYVTNNSYNVSGGNVGAMGENANASNFSQTSAQVADTLDLAALVPELQRLQEALKHEAVDGEHYVSLAAVAKAREAAEAGDTNAAVGNLVKAGGWALSVAEKIGVGLAVLAIKGGIGL